MESEFSYDTYGNVWLIPGPNNSGVPIAGNTPISNVYNTANQIGGSGNYDTAGNQLLLNGNTATYDAENRITQITAPASTGGGTASYAYDGLGQRIRKTLLSGTTVYVYDALGQLAAEYSGTATIHSPCWICYLSTDQLGSTRLVTDQSGNVVARHDYLPFGEDIGTSGGRTGNVWSASSDTGDQRFTGQVRDQESGLDYFNARYFDPALAHFTSPDPGNAGANLYDPQTWNAYAYVRNSPLNSVDPTGKYLVDCSWDVCPSHGGSDGGGGGAVIDGVEQTVYNTSGLGSNGLAACPNNFCSGFTQTQDGSTQYVQYRASGGLGAQGYQTMQQMATANYDWNGQFLTQQQFHKQVIQPYISDMQAKLTNALGTSPVACANDLVGGNLNCTTSEQTLQSYLDANTCITSTGQARCDGPGYSLHFHFTDVNDITVHMDSANPGIFPWPIRFPGVLIHFGIDVLGGNTVFSAGVPHP